MTREEADFIGGMNMCDEISNEAYKKIMCHCEEQEPCEDAISRQAVMDVLCNDCELFRNGEQTCFTKCEEYHFLATLPPVKPQQKIGQWIKGRDCYGNNHFTCPFCGNDIATKYDGIWKDNYCSNCGAKMQESEEV